MEHQIIPLDPRLEIGVDSLGDPFVRCHIVMPPGGSLSADAADHLALQLVAAAAAARTRASMVRKQLLAGVPTEEAVRVVNDLLEP